MQQWIKCREILKPYILHKTSDLSEGERRNGEQRAIANSSTCASCALRMGPLRLIPYLTIRGLYTTNLTNRNIPCRHLSLTSPSVSPSLNFFLDLSMDPFSSPFTTCRLHHFHWLRQLWPWILSFSFTFLHLLMVLSITLMFISTFICRYVFESL